MNRKLALGTLGAVICLFLLFHFSRRESFVKPGANLVLENIPPIPASVARDADRYDHSTGGKMFCWSPVGYEMLFGARQGAALQVFRLKKPGGPDSQLTASRDPILWAEFEPDDTDGVIFGKGKDGDEKYQFYRYDTLTKKTTLLTDGKSRNNHSLLAHHGTLMAYISNRRDGVDFDLYLMDVKDRRTDHMVLQLDGAGWSPLDFSEDGKQLLLSRYYSVNKSELYLADIANEKVRRISPLQTEGKPISYGRAQFAKGKNRIYGITDQDSDFQRLAYFDLPAMTPHYLTASIRGDVESFDLSEDGRTIAFVTNEDGISKLYALDTVSGLVRSVAIPVGVIRGIDLHPDGRDLGFTLTSARVPSDVYSVDLLTGALTRWTYGRVSGVRAESLPEPKLVSWKSFDGLRITGLLYEPDPTKFPGKRPVILNIHGGPEGQSRPVFLWRDNYFLNELGIALLYPNVRGSTGFGKAFTKLDNGLLRDHAYKDIGAILDWIPTQPSLDAQRVMVTGVSYGGTMAWAVAAFYNDKITCALPVVGCSNLVTFLEHTEAYRRDLRRAEHGDERSPAMRAYLEKIAPMNHLDLMHKPIFAVVGKNDPRVPWTESRQIIDKLKAQGTPTWFLIANDEGHGYAKRANQEIQFDTMVMFVRKYLLGLE